MLTDTADGRRRKVYALIFTAVYSRHMFVWLSYSQTLAAVIAGCQAAWGVLRRGVRGADPRQHEAGDRRRRCGQPATDRRLAGLRRLRRFATDPARVRSPKDKPALSGPFSMCVATSGTETFTDLDTARTQRRRGAPRSPGSGSTAPRAPARPSVHRRGATHLGGRPGAL